MPKIKPVHPGEILDEEFMTPMGLSAYKLAQASGLTQSTIGQIKAGRRAITPETAIRLGAAFGTSAEFWLNLQSRYDLEHARNQQPRLAGEVTPVSKLVDAV